ncbi:unnamed protein product [Closterium sp. NIES-53]
MNIKGLDFISGRYFLKRKNQTPNSAVVQKVLEEYKDIIPNDLPVGVPPKQTHQHEIVEEPGSKPTFLAPYRLGPAERADMKKQIEYLLDRKRIRPSTSPYDASVLFTPKLEGSLWICILVSAKGVHMDPWKTEAARS